MNFRAVWSALAAVSFVFAARTAAAATCSLGEHAGIDEAEAKTASRVVCHEVVARSAPGASFEVRIGKLGGRTLVSVTADGDASREVRTFVNGLDELDIAAPRLATSLVEAKPLAETRNVDNVLTEEGRAAKKVASVVGATTGMYVLSSVGDVSTPSAGIDVGLQFRTGHFGLTGDGRLGGIGSGATKINNVSLDVGARLYLTDGEYAPFFGGGVGMSSIHRKAPDAATDREGSGAGAFASIGIEALRSSHVGLIAALRLDLPFYSLETVKRSSTDYYYSDSPSTPAAPPPARTTAYVAPISLTLALSFH